MAYDIQHRSDYLSYISELKWQFREQGQFYKQWEDENPEIANPKWPKNLCKNQPKSVIKYINMQTSLCPLCKRINLIARCSQEHLRDYHRIQFDSVQTLATKVLKLTTAQIKKKRIEDRQTRGELVKYAESLILPNITKLQTFLDSNAAFAAI